LPPLYPKSVHVKDVELQTEDDDAVWEYAKKQGLTIVSKDMDFLQRSMLHGHPPKVVWLCTGNCPTITIEEILREHHSDLLIFQRDEDASLLVLS
jgi:predicted nuclease of predicted toxin-antitoxin system